MAGPWEDFGGGTDGPWSAFAPKPKRTLTQDVTGAMANVNRGTGIGDELAAAGNVIGGLVTGRHRFGLDKPGNPIANNLNMLSDAYKTELAGQRQSEDSFSAAHPNTAALARGTGMAATAVIPAGDANVLSAGVRGFNVPTAMNALRGATTAGLTAAGYAAADRGTLAERAQGAAGAARNPVVLALGAAGGALATPGAARAPKLKAPTLDELTAQKNAAYGAIDSAGVTYAPQATDRLIKNVTSDLQGASINPARHPKAASMLSDIQAMRGQSPTLTQLDQLRQVVRRDVANSSDQADAYMGKRIISQIDDFVNGAGPKDIVGGTLGPDAAAQALSHARDLNTRVVKIEKINDAAESAKLRAGSTGSGGNVNNATRQNLRRVLETTPNFTPGEGAALRNVVVGDKTQNVLRQVGKLSPSGNGLMLAGHIGAGVATHGASALVGGVGAVSKMIADAMTSRNTDKLVEMISSGPAAAQAREEVQRQLAQMALTSPAADALRRQVAAKLSKAVGVAGAAAASSRNVLAQP